MDGGIIYVNAMHVLSMTKTKNYIELMTTIKKSVDNKSNSIFWNQYEYISYKCKFVTNITENDVMKEIA